jgi:hypothetical protein
MPQRDPSFVKRQAQWDAFHQWESSNPHSSLTIEKRIAWYRAAARFGRSRVKEADSERIERRIKVIGEIRKRLARLDESLRNG